MQSAIGQHFRSQRASRFAFAIAIAIATVAIDFFAVLLHSTDAIRFALALTSFATIVYLADGDLSSVGLRPSPKQGWRPWIFTSLKIGVIVGICIAVGFGIWRLTGHEIPIYFIQPSAIVSQFLHMCVVAPVLEETIYRLVLCIPLARMAGCLRTIAINGVLFGALHVAYGNPSPENLVGGFFLAWVYLKSETIVLPVLLHSLGNFIALASQVAAWHYLR